MFCEAGIYIHVYIHVPPAVHMYLDLRGLRSEVNPALLQRECCKCVVMNK